LIAYTEAVGKRELEVMNEEGELAIDSREDGRTQKERINWSSDTLNRVLNLL